VEGANVLREGVYVFCDGDTRITVRFMSRAEFFYCLNRISGLQDWEMPVILQVPPGIQGLQGLLLMINFHRKDIPGEKYTI